VTPQKAIRGRPPTVKVPEPTPPVEPPAPPPEPPESDMDEPLPKGVVERPVARAGVKSDLWDALKICGYDMDTLCGVCSGNPKFAQRALTWGNWDDVTEADAVELSDSLVITRDELKFKTKRANAKVV